jgi:hypothetical protein
MFTIQGDAVEVVTTPLGAGVAFAAGASTGGDVTGNPEVAGASTTREDGEVAGIMESIAERIMPTTMEDACIYLTLLVLIGMLLVWSIVDDGIMGGGAHTRRIILMRNGAVLVLSALGVYVYRDSAIMASYWWVVLVLWALYVTYDYYVHQALSGWNSRMRNMYFIVVAVGAGLIGFATSALCVWWPFVIVALISLALLNPFGHRG